MGPLAAEIHAAGFSARKFDTPFEHTSRKRKRPQPHLNRLKRQDLQRNVYLGNVYLRQVYLRQVYLRQVIVGTSNNRPFRSPERDAGQLLRRS